MARPGRPRTAARPQKSLGKVSIPHSVRYQQLMDGTLSVEDLTDEEILRGQLLDKEGKFRGRPPEYLPRDLYTSLTRELRLRMMRKFEEHGMEAVATIVEIMQDGEGAEETEFDERGRPIGKTKGGVKRLEAAKYIVERILGPIAKEIAPEGEKTPWERAQSDGTIIVDIEPHPEDAHLITKVEEPRKPIRRKMVQGEVIE